MQKLIFLNKKKQTPTFVIILLLFPFIQQRTYQELPLIGSFYLLYSTLATIIIYCRIIPIMHKLFKLRPYLYLVTLFVFFSILSTFINPTEGKYRSTGILLSFLSLCFILAYESKKSPGNLLKALQLIYGFFIFSNMVLDVLFPNGLYTNITGSQHSSHFLGDDNALIFVFLPGLTCMICYSIYKFREILLYNWIAVWGCLITLILVWSVSAFLCMGLFTFLLFLLLIHQLPSPYFLMAILCGIILICIFGLSNPSIQNFIDNYLGKDATLSGRTILWASAIEMIMKKPVLGWGGYFINGFWDFSSTFAYPCHTQYLQMLIDGGFVVFVIFWIITLLAYREAKRVGGMLASVLVIGLTCMLINYITEWSTHYHYFIIVSLMLNLDNFSKERQTVKLSYRR